MAFPPNPHVAENPRRWLASGQPRQWVEAHRGQWDHAEWLKLLGSLHNSPYWPMEPAAVGAILEEQKRRYLHLQRWLASGQPRRWVEERKGSWNHTAWLTLLQDLQKSEFWPMEPAAIGQVLEEQKRRWFLLQRWEASGQARRWVEQHRSGWNHADWLALLDTLQKSEFWPMEPDAVGRVLEQCKRELDSGKARERPTRRAMAPAPVEKNLVDLFADFQIVLSGPGIREGFGQFTVATHRPPMPASANR